MAYNETELNNLFTRVLNEKKQVEEKDEAYLVRYMNELFAEGTNPSSHEIHQFNNLIVKKADEITRAQATEVLKVLADFETVSSRSAFQYTIPKQFKATAVWAADGTSVQRTRVDGDETRIATPRRLQGGFYYEPATLVNADVERFRELVNGIAKAKLRLYWQAISRLTDAAITSGDIPAKNVLTGSNLDLADYRKLASTLARYGGKPTFVADTIFIDHFAQQQTTPTYINTASDARLDELFTSLNITSIATTNAVSLVNPFIAGSGNTQVELPVNEGYMFAGGVKEKPFKVIEFGGMVQQTEYHYEIEQVELKFYQNVAIEFIQGEAVGYIKDDAVAL